MKKTFKSHLDVHAHRSICVKFRHCLPELRAAALPDRSGVDGKATPATSRVAFGGFIVSSHEDFRGKRNDFLRRERHEGKMIREERCLRCNIEVPTGWPVGNAKTQGPGVLKDRTGVCATFALRGNIVKTSGFRNHLRHFTSISKTPVMRLQRV